MKRLNIKIVATLLILAIIIVIGSITYSLSKQPITLGTLVLSNPFSILPSSNPTTTSTSSQIDTAADSEPMSNQDSQSQLTELQTPATNEASKPVTCSSEQTTNAFTSTTSTCITPTPLPSPISTATSEPTCKAVPEQKPKTYTESNNGNTVTVNKGSTFYVKLPFPEHGSCSYFSDLSVSDGLSIIDKQILPLGAGHLVPMTGGGEINQWEIKAIGTGTQKVKCPDKNFELTVNIEG